jgi:hypothetical protein
MERKKKRQDESGSGSDVSYDPTISGPDVASPTSQPGYAGEQDKERARELAERTVGRQRREG